jgi:exonuclease III
VIAAQSADVVALVLARLTRAGRPHILAGDLNALHPGDAPGAPPEGERLRSVARTADGQRGALAAFLAARYVDCYRAEQPRAGGYTFRTSHPWLRLDYILASPGQTSLLMAAGVADGARAAEASDHFPVWAEFDVQVWAGPGDGQGNPAGKMGRDL